MKIFTQFIIIFCFDADITDFRATFFETLFWIKKEREREKINSIELA